MNQVITCFWPHEKWFVFVGLPEPMHCKNWILFIFTDYLPSGFRRLNMGLTKQYLRYVASAVFGLIGSQKGNIVFVTLRGEKGRYVAVPACEHVFIWDLRKGEKVSQKWVSWYWLWSGRDLTDLPALICVWALKWSCPFASRQLAPNSAVFWKSQPNSLLLSCLSVLIFIGH